MYSLLQLSKSYIKEDVEIPLPAETADGDVTLNTLQVIYLQCSLNSLNNHLDQHVKKLMSSETFGEIVLEEIYLINFIVIVIFWPSKNNFWASTSWLKKG